MQRFEDGGEDSNENLQHVLLQRIPPAGLFLFVLLYAVPA